VLLVSICTSGVKALRPVPLTMIENAMPLMASNAHPACEYCSRGAHMLPLLIQHYRVKSLAEIGVCTGMSVVHVAGDRVRGIVFTGDGVHGGSPPRGIVCAPPCYGARTHRIALA
jgi:hypothetical protein